MERDIIFKYKHLIDYLLFPQYMPYVQIRIDVLCQLELFTSSEEQPCGHLLHPFSGVL